MPHPFTVSSNALETVIVEQKAPTSANRQARFKEALRAQGIAPVNVLAPIKAHDTIKELARRLRDGEDLGRALGSLSRKVDGRAVAGVELPPVTIPDDLTPGPGEVAMAIRLTKKTSGYVKDKVRASGLVRSGFVSAWVGIVPVEVGEELRRRVEATGGTVVERVG